MVVSCCVFLSNPKIVGRVGTRDFCFLPFFSSELPQTLPVVELQFNWGILIRIRQPRFQLTTTFHSLDFETEISQRCGISILNIQSSELNMSK